MRRDRKAAPAVTLAIATLSSFAAGLAGCTSMSRLAAEPRQPVSLAGSWKLDPAHSTDSRKALADLLAAGRRGRRGGGEMDRGLGGGQGGAGSREGPTPGGMDPAVAALLSTGPEELAPDIALQRSLLAGGDWLQIEQRPDELVISNGATSHSYVPGEHSVVSVPSGVADQRSGWKGREYWIELKPQVGPGAIERLKLSADGRRLIETIEIGGEGRIPKLAVTRTYEPTAEIPSVVPAGD